MKFSKGKWKIILVLIWFLVIVFDYGSILNGEKPLFMIPIELQFNKKTKYLSIGLGYAVDYKENSPKVSIVQSDFYIFCFKVQTINTY
jgi:hypothetical protein